MIGGDPAAGRSRDQPERKTPASLRLGFGSETSVYRAELILPEEHASPVRRRTHHVLLMLFIPACGVALDLPKLTGLPVGKRSDPMDIRAAKAVGKARIAGSSSYLHRTHFGLLFLVSAHVVSICPRLRCLHQRDQI